MAKQSSRELSLERRKALSQSGKKSTAMSGTSPNRVRSSSDARTTRTSKSFVKSSNTSLPKSPKSNFAHSPSPSTASSSTRRNVKAVSHPSRELVLARREALSRRGKSADTSKDRTRIDVQKELSTPTDSTQQINRTKSSNLTQSETQTSVASSVESSRGFNLTPRNGERRSTKKRRAIQNTSRAFVLARREAQSKHGKTAGKQPTSAASVARQGDPDLTSRELAQRVRELRSKSGATGKQRSGTTRPCGPNKNGAKQSAASDAFWKVGMSETQTGQVVTGTQANRSAKTTGNEASTCRSITGTQYLGTEVFESFCQSSLAPSQPSKIQVTNTSHGNQVTGNEVSRSEKVTGNEPGTCKNLTGTEYISANQTAAYCGEVSLSPRKVGQSLTLDGRKVSGVMVGRTERVTGNEAGYNKGLTGDQYLGSDPLPEGRPAEKVGSFNTLSGSNVTGTNVARSEFVTGNEPGSCKRVTGDEYVGPQQFTSFCGAKPSPEASKVGLSLTNKSQTVSGTLTGRSQLVTGDEPGTCKVVTGTPYAGFEQANQWCESKSVNEIHQRTPKRLGTPGPRMTGQQPGIGGVMTGADRGACEPLTGTPYVGSDQLAQACGTNNSLGVNESIDNTTTALGTQFSVQSPAKAAQIERERSSSVTGSSYEKGANITGPFDMAENKVTGTEQFRFDYNQRQRDFSATQKSEVIESQGASRPLSRITGEGQSEGLNITGDDWARGEVVTGTEGASSRKRNPSQPGPMNAMRPPNKKRNEELAQPDFLITGASGNTREGQLVTFSGGARG